MAETAGIIARNGATLLVDCLVAAGVEVVFGVPGIHALELWDAFVPSPLIVVGHKHELAAGFAADGYARAGERPGVVVTTTGPGAMVAAAALLEAASSYVPLVNIVTQIPSQLIGRGKGYLHETPAQTGVLTALAKLAFSVRAPDELPEVVAAAFRAAVTAPQGPVVIEVPVDLLGDGAVARPRRDPGNPIAIEMPPSAALDAAVARLANAEQPVVWAGGGVVRGRGAAEFTALAERLDAPAVTTFMGKGAISSEHPLAAGSGCYEGAFADLLASADVVVAIGTELAAETTGEWTFELPGLIHIDIQHDKIGTNYPALGLVGDAAPVMQALVDRLPPPRDRGGSSRAQEVRERITTGLESQAEHAADLQFLDDVKAGLDDDAIAIFDMTIAGYMAASHFPVTRPGGFMYPLGSGTLGYALPAAIGAKLAAPDREVVAVHGDGGVLYSMFELLTAADAGAAVRLVVIDDGGYGILRMIQIARFGRTSGVDFAGPDFVLLGRSLGVEVISTTLAGIEGSLRKAAAFDTPVLIHVKGTLGMADWTP